MTDKEEVIYEGKDSSHKISSATGFFSPSANSSIQVNWSAENCGFGSFTMGFDKERGTMVIDSEMMGPDFVSKVMEKLIRESLFTDFEKVKKQVTSVSVEEANNVFGFQKNVLRPPFYEEDTKSGLYQMRWHIANKKVLNIWFESDIVGKTPDESFEFIIEISDKKSFEKGFVKAEVWSWEVSKRP